MRRAFRLLAPLLSPLTQAVRLRPMLVFEKHHADLFLAHLSEVLREL